MPVDRHCKRANLGTPDLPTYSLAVNSFRARYASGAAGWGIGTGRKQLKTNDKARKWYGGTVIRWLPLRARTCARENYARAHMDYQ